jgi:hypothetical protein
MARCYKSADLRPKTLDQMAISQAPIRLENPRETKAFAIGNWAGKWSITTVQIGNNFAHTVRDKSQVKSRFKHHKINDVFGF